MKVAIELTKGNIFVSYSVNFNCIMHVLLTVKKYTSGLGSMNKIIGR